LHAGGDLEVAFNIATEEFALPDAKIRAVMDSPSEFNWYPIRTLLRLGRRQQIDLYKRHEQLSDSHIDRVLARLDRLRPENIKINFFNINGKNYGDVAEIFERINLGTPVKRSQIALGKLSTVYRGAVSDVEQHLGEMRRQHGVRFDLDLFMAAFSVLTTGKTDVSGIEKKYLSTATEKSLRLDVAKTMKALAAALAFVDQHLFIDTMKYFSSPRTLVCVAYVLDQHSGALVGTEAKRLAHWIARALLEWKHAAEYRWARDIAIIRDTATESVVDELLQNVGDGGDALAQLADLDSPIARNNVLFGFLYAMIRRKGAVSFPSTGYPIRTVVVEDADEDEDAGEPTAGARCEAQAIHEHHIYPDARLKAESLEPGGEWLTKAWIYDLANFTFITESDNLAIGDQGIEYLTGVSAEQRQRHLIPVSRFRKGDYERLLTARRKLIQLELQSFLQALGEV